MDLLSNNQLIIKKVTKSILNPHSSGFCILGVFPHHAFISVVGTLQNQTNQNLFSTELNKNFFCTQRSMEYDERKNQTNLCDR